MLLIQIYNNLVIAPHFLTFQTQKVAIFETLSISMNEKCEETNKKMYFCI
jgi:hypothetical protein